MLGETFRVDRRRGDDQLQVAAPLQDALHHPEEEIDIERALVRLVDDDRIVLLEEGIGLRFGQKNAVGHDLHQRRVDGMVGEADLEPDGRSRFGLQLLAEAAGDGSRGDSARLRVADLSVDPPADLQADLRELRRFAASGLAADDHRLVPAKKLRDVTFFGGDRQLRIVADLRKGLSPGGGAPRGTGDFFGQDAELLGGIAVAVAGGAARQTAERPSQTAAVAEHRPAEFFLQF